jgi:hypothetical protein
MELHAFHTPDYMPLAIQCQDSFLPHGIGVRLVPVEKQETWIKTCLLRPTLLVDKSSPVHPIGLIDADVHCVARPSCILDSGEDWNVLLDDRGQDARDRDRFAAHLVIFKGVDGHETMWRWASICHRDPNPELAIREQQYLMRAIQEVQPRVRNIHGRIFVPPKTWDGRSMPDGTEMLHLPASRKLEGGTYLNSRL